MNTNACAFFRLKVLRYQFLLEVIVRVCTKMNVFSVAMSSQGCTLQVNTWHSEAPVFLQYVLWIVITVAAWLEL